MKKGRKINKTNIFLFLLLGFLVFLGFKPDVYEIVKYGTIKYTNISIDGYNKIAPEEYNIKNIPDDYIQEEIVDSTLIDTISSEEVKLKTLHERLDLFLEENKEMLYTHEDSVVYSLLIEL